jgi:hypothetical protein
MSTTNSSDPARTKHQGLSIRFSIVFAIAILTFAVPGFAIKPDDQYTAGDCADATVDTIEECLMGSVDPATFAQWRGSLDTCSQAHSQCVADATAKYFNNPNETATQYYFDLQACSSTYYNCVTCVTLSPTNPQHCL